MGMGDPAITAPSRFDWRVGAALVALHVGALLALLPMFFRPSAVVVMFVLIYATSGLGVSLGFHRLLTHRSLRLAKPIEYAIALLGTLALQGGPISWVGTHRIHHAHSDHEGDPHNANLGFFWSHFEWLLYSKAHCRERSDEYRRAVTDLTADPYYVFLENNQLQLQAALALILFALGGWSWVVWGIFARSVVVYHITWLVNSASHTTGYRTYRTTDRSTNCWWLALLGWGEGWHNNHHAFPFSARHGLQWYEFDLTWLTIKFLAFVRLAKDIKLPTPEMRHRLRLTTPS
jgi:stearoyl-CoA desaturase (delta-9 desaturase)